MTRFRHPRIYTGAPPNGRQPPTVQQIVVSDGAVTGDGDAASPTVDLPGAAVLPGFIDTHAHLSSFGGSEADLDLRDVADPASLLEKVRHAAGRADTRHGWLRGRGWSLAAPASFGWADRLDAAAGGQRVMLVRRDGHALLASRAALQQAQITAATLDPPGGMIHRQADGRTPSGLLVDAAMDAVTASLPKPSVDEVAREASSKLQQLAAAGVTCVHEAYVEPDLWAALQRLQQRGTLPLRVRALLGPSWDALPTEQPTPKLRAIGFKLLADGALGSHGAQLSERYADIDARGLAVCSDAQLTERATLAARLGVQLAVHAIGDAAVSRVLALFESHAEASLTNRWRIEHAQIVAPSDLPRLAGRCVATQPIHFAADAEWALCRLGLERLDWAYRAGSLLRTGAIVGFGSDFPIEDASPLAGVAAITDPPPAPWERSAEQLMLHEALDGYWHRAATLAFDEHALGRLQPGYLADFVCLARDPFADRGHLHDNEIIATYVGGRRADQP